MIEHRPSSPPPHVPSQGGEHAAEKEVVHRSGMRQALSDRVTLLDDRGTVLVGRALDVSRGGVRVLLPDPIEVGDEYEVILGQIQGAIPYRGRIVWVRAADEGVEVGVEFLATSGMHKSAPPAAGIDPPDGN